MSGKRKVPAKSKAADRPGTPPQAGASGHKHASAELAASEIRLRTIVETQAECVKVVAPDGTLLEMNPAGLTMIEADSADQVLGKSVLFLIAPEHREAFRAHTKRVCRGEHGSLEFEIVGLKGTRRWLESHDAPLPDEKGAIIGALGVTRDITKRKHDERVQAATYRIADAVNTTHGLDELLATIHRIVGEVIPATNLFVALFDPATNTISFPYFADELDPAPPAPMKVGDRSTLTEYVLRTGKPLLATDEVFAEMVKRGEVAQVGAASIDWLGVPLMANDRCIGVLAVQSYSPGVRYRERDAEILRFVSTQVAQAIARKQAEDELRSSEAQLRALVGSMTDVILVLDAEGRYVKIAETGTELLFRPAAELLGRTLHEVFPRDQADAFLALIRRALETHKPVQADYALTLPGQEVHFSATVSPMGPDTVLWVARDVTEREAREAQLREAHSLIAAALDATADGILIVDRAGAATSSNRRFAELWRIPADLLATRDDDRLLAYVLDQLADPELFIAKVRQLYADPGAESSDILDFKDGRRFERHSLPQRIGDEVVGRVWSFRDVSERTSLERQLRQATKMEAVGRLAGGVAHDFNNLLTAITGYTELLLDDLAPEDPRRQDVEEIRKAADRAAALTRQLLAFSRRQVLQPKVLDLNVVVRSAEKLLRRVIGEQIRLELELEPTLRAVKADPNQLEQVIVNLAVNARDAMPEGGTLTIATAAVVLEPSATATHGIPATGPFVQLTVRDTGHGMDAEVKQSIFEPFFTTKDTGKGTGLGLATVYGIVKQSGGFVWVESEPGRGATFRVCLPPTDQPIEPNTEQGSADVVARGTEVVLVAEDEDAVRNVARQTLTRRGYTVLEAAGGQAALHAAAGHGGRIDLLLTDVVMPGMNGKQLADALTALRPGTRVLFMSGYTDDAIVRQGMLEPGIAFLQKPFTPDRLAQRVREVLDQT